MSKCFWKVVGFAELPPGALAMIPSDGRTRDILHKHKPGDVISTNRPSKPRHPGHHRKYWAMIGLVHEASNVSELFATPQHLHDAIKGALGYWTEIRLPTGQSFKKIDSTAFESMSQDEFQEFYDKAVALICDQIVPGLDSAELEREVMELIK